MARRSSKPLRHRTTSRATFARASPSCWWGRRGVLGRRPASTRVSSRPVGRRPMPPTSTARAGWRRSRSCRWCSSPPTPGETVWALVDALRPLTMAPLVVATPTSSSTVVSLVNAGVDAVVDPRSGPDEVFARVVALLRRSDHGWAPGVRFLRAGDRLVVDLRVPRVLRSTASPSHCRPPSTRCSPSS